MPDLWVCWLGEVDYRQALALQQRVCEARQDGRIPDTMLLLEHPPTITRGRRAAPEDLPAGFAAPGVEVIDVNRGGKLTYHGPGQLVGYPIVAVSDVVAYVRSLERALVAALSEQGVVAHARVDDGPDYTGVWVENRKIASIGVHVARGVTTHGFAVNVDNDMTPWTWFTACGLPSVQMTSVLLEGAAGEDCRACFRKRAGVAVAAELGMRQRLVTPAALERALSGSPLVL